MPYYATSLEHLLAEVERIDLLIHVQVERARQVRPVVDALADFAMAGEAVDELLAQPAGLPAWATATAFPAEVQAALAALSAAIESAKAASYAQGISLRLVELAQRFQLSSFARDILLLGLAPELDLRYERLYSFLNDDLTRKRPSVDVVLNLLCPSFAAKVAARRHFMPDAPLCKHRLLHLSEDPTQSPGGLLNKLVQVDPRVVNYLLEQDELDPRLTPYARLSPAPVALAALILPKALKQRLTRLVAEQWLYEPGLLVYCQGPADAGKQTVAAALCQTRGLPLLVVEGARLLQTEINVFATLVGLAQREACLQGAALYWQDFDRLLLDEQQARRETLLQALAATPGLTFLAGASAWEPPAAMRSAPFVHLEFARPAATERLQLWQGCLNGRAPDAAALALMASHFRLSAGQIQTAVHTAHHLAHERDPSAPVTPADLQAACRRQAHHNLATLARRVITHATWDDLVLPGDRKQQLRELCDHVRHRTQVHDQWGFDRKLGLGKGLHALFAGPSGTGKTMAAGIIAAELGVELYQIDLATMVSKYIGETEKNLARIFSEAENSNAILFFDEADALFGKRSEVKDAHDRYANLEVAYLLQRMEEYSGITILATNLRKNMDEAFVRRLHFILEFPFPNERDRRRIWAQVWPAATPRDPALDLDFMARRCEIAGGHIRNVALAAAFLAAADGGVVTMPHLIHATRREYQKLGKMVGEGEFGVYG